MEVIMVTKGQKKALSSEAVQLTVILTPEGVQAARKRLDNLEAQAKAKAWQELRKLIDNVRKHNTGFSEEEIEADITETVEEVRTERYRQAIQQKG
jgi:hypothetical protein